MFFRGKNCQHSVSCSNFRTYRFDHVMKIQGWRSSLEDGRLSRARSISLADQAIYLSPCVGNDGICKPNSKP